MKLKNKLNNHPNLKVIIFLLAFLFMLVGACKKEVDSVPQKETVIEQSDLIGAISNDSSLKILSLVSSRAYANGLVTEAKKDNFTNVDALENRFKQINKLVTGLTKKYQLKDGEAIAILGQALNHYRLGLLTSGRKDEWRLDYVTKPMAIPNKLNSLKGFKDARIAYEDLNDVTISGVSLSDMRNRWYSATAWTDFNCLHLVNNREFEEWINRARSTPSGQVNNFLALFDRWIQNVDSALDRCNSKFGTSDPFGDNWNPAKGNGGSGSGSGSKTGVGSGDGGNVIPTDPIMPGQDHNAVNPKDYVKCFENISDAGAKFKVSVQVQEPLPNTDLNYGINGVGHAAITMTKTGSNGESITQTIGFYPAANKWSGPSKIVNNGNDMDFTIQMNFESNAQNFNAILLYISNPPPVYQLPAMNCTAFVVNACAEGAIVLPSAWSNIAGALDPLNVFRSMTPAGLGQSMRELDGKGDKRVKTSIGKAPSSKGPCK